MNKNNRKKKAIVSKNKSKRNAITCHIPKTGGSRKRSPKNATNYSQKKTERFPACSIGNCMAFANCPAEARSCTRIDAFPPTRRPAEIKRPGLSGNILGPFKLYRNYSNLRRNSWRL